MLTIQSPSLRTGATAPNDAPLTAATGSDPAGFASLLRQSRSATPPAPVAPPAPTPAPQAVNRAPDGPEAKSPERTQDHESSENDAADATGEAEGNQRGRALQRARLRAADGRADANRATPAASAHAAVPSARAQAASAATDEPTATAAPDQAAPAAPLDPAVMHWLADQQRAPGAAPAAGKGEATTGDATVQDASQNIPADTNGRPRAGAGVTVERDADAGASRPRATDSTVDATAAAAPFAAVLAERQGHDKPSATERGGVRGIEGATGAAALAPTPDTSTAAAAPAVAISAPVQTPDFAQELGLRLSVLARDGVHEAELHLNPADMGPVSVQIVMDGTQARIDFGADVAATRQAIEAGLPELASALRDAGFTLAGGGVSQHAGGRQEGGGNGRDPSSNGERRTVAAPELQRVATAARRLVRAGGVDLFA